MLFTTPSFVFTQAVPCVQCKEIYNIEFAVAVVGGVDLWKTQFYIGFMGNPDREKYVDNLREPQCFSTFSTTAQNPSYLSTNFPEPFPQLLHRSKTLGLCPNPPQGVLPLDPFSAKLCFAGQAGGISNYISFRKQDSASKYCIPE